VLGAGKVDKEVERQREEAKKRRAELVLQAQQARAADPVEEEDDRSDQRAQRDLPTDGDDDEDEKGGGGGSQDFANWLDNAAGEDDDDDEGEYGDYRKEERELPGDKRGTPLTPMASLMVPQEEEADDFMQRLDEAMAGGDAEGVVSLFEGEVASQDTFLKALRELPELDDQGQQSELDLLTLYRRRGYSTSEGFTAALRGAFEAGALRKAISLFAAWQNSLDDVELPTDVHRGILQVLGIARQLPPAIAHIRTRMEEGCSHEQAQLFFNSLLEGIVHSGKQDSTNAVGWVAAAMDEAKVEKDSETLALLVEAAMLAGAPSFIKEVGKTVLQFVRTTEGDDEAVDGGHALGGPGMWAVCAAHMRSGDLDAAYKWVLASQLLRGGDRPNLSEGRGPELLSDLTRALAINGQAKRVLRLLNRAVEDGAKLPSTAASVSISGCTSGRTQATVWLEPPAEFIRRRSLWSSQQGQNPQVKCAEQFDWERQEQMRHENYQWAPYLAPDTKLERAWLAPLRMEDIGFLGLARDWNGETPTQTAARERLGERPQEGQAYAIGAAMERSLRLLPVSQQMEFNAATEKDTTLGIFMMPEPQSWRVYHADAVKRAFLTPKRLMASSPEQFRDVLRKDHETRTLLADYKEPQMLSVPMSDIQLSVARISEDLKESIVEEQTKNWEEKKAILHELGYNDKKVTEGGEILRTAKMLILNPDMALPKPKEDVQQKITDLEYDVLEELWIRNYAGGIRATEEVFGEALTRQVDFTLDEELEEDETLDGSPADELRLALEIAGALQQLGQELSSADRRALLSAAHACGDQEVAALVVKGVMKEHWASPEAIVATKKSGIASSSVADAMEAGGWDRASAEAFLQGEVLLPRRTGGRGLGGLQTRLIDPMMGLGLGADDDDMRQEVCEHLMGETSGSAGVTEIKVRLTTGTKLTDESIAVVTREQVLARAAARPLEVQRLLSESSWQIRNADADDAAKLASLGLPVPESKVMCTKLWNFARNIVTESLSMREAAKAEVQARRRWSV